MPALENPISFIATTKPVDCREFYENILGLQCMHEDDYALVFDLGVSSLRIQKVASIPDIEYTSLGWEVLDIKATVEELTSKGVNFEEFTQLEQDQLGIWYSPSGAAIAWFKDPDGNTLSLTEPS